MIPPDDMEHPYPLKDGWGHIWPHQDPDEGPPIISRSWWSSASEYELSRWAWVGDWALSRSPILRLPEPVLSLITSPWVGEQVPPHQAFFGPPYSSNRKIPTSPPAKYTVVQCKMCRLLTLDQFSTVEFTLIKLLSLFTGNSKLWRPTSWPVSNRVVFKLKLVHNLARNFRYTCWCHETLHSKTTMSD